MILINLMKSYLSFKIILLILFSCILSQCNGQTQNNLQNDNQTKAVGGNFENSDFTYSGIPKFISAIDTSLGWNQNGQKLLLTGTVYKIDGKTPAADVVLYYYHTNTEGRYIHLKEESISMPPNQKGQTHGYIRGWVKTNSEGKYYIFTVRPGIYPTRGEPAHIHVTVKEPNNLKEYYLDDFVFDDDKLLKSARRKSMTNRGGSGVLRLVQKDDLQIGERNIFLGLNIPDYPDKPNETLNSGRNIGEDIISFIPYHAWGPDKGTRTCPICKYGWYHGILFFVGNNPDWTKIKQWLIFLESESKARENYLKVYFVYGNEKDYNKNDREVVLNNLGTELDLKHVALTYVPSFNDSESEVNHDKINPEVENTIILYKRSKVVDKFINLEPTASSFKLIRESLDKSENEYFDIPKPK